jgi:putative ABC transport system ATP-binding protein
MENAIDAPEPNHDIAVRCRNVTKEYGAGDASVMALRGIDLDVRRGELLMVVGPSGCGKTTLISVIAGILDQDSGQCEVLGRDLKLMGQNERARFRGLSIGFVFQLFNLLPALNAVENVSVPLLINGIARKNAEARAQEVLETVSLGSRLDALPGKLSGGQQQRVAIARALINHPSILLADEPTGNLDTRTSIEIMDTFQRLNDERGLTILLVTHEPDVARFARRAVHFRDGQILSDTPVHERACAAEILATLTAGASETAAEEGS